MKYRQRIIQDNARTILKVILRYLKVGDFSCFWRLMQEHPDFPSFLTLQYILERMGKDSFALRTNYEDLLYNLPKPLIVRVETNVEIFLFLVEVTDTDIGVLTDQGKVDRIDREAFERMWQGEVLVMDNDPAKSPFTLKDRLKSEVRRWKYLLFISGLLLSVIYLWIYWGGPRTILDGIYFFIISVGLLISTLLFTEQVDKHNPYIKKICSSRQSKGNVDCSSILNSKDAEFIGLISWTDIGMIYFSILWLVLLFFPSFLSLTFVNVLSFCSFGYVFYSLYYQRYVARKWCTLCLSIQGVFVVLFLLAVCTFSFIDIQAFCNPVHLLGLFLLSFFVIALFIVIKPLIQHSFELRVMKNRYNELVYDSQIQNYLLHKGDHIQLSDLEVIRIGGSADGDRLTIVFSPVCEACIRELREIIPVLSRKRKLMVELVFLLDKHRYPESEKMALHMLQIYQNDKTNFIYFLNDYVHNYPGSTYSINFHTYDPSLIRVLEDQENWCKIMRFTHTPLVFLNDIKFPEVYALTDLDYICS